MIVAKAELGMKLTCDSCGARFYDLNKQPGICPKCGTANARPVIFKASRQRPSEDKLNAAKAAALVAKPVVDPDDVDVETDDDDEDEAVIEDTSDLGEDDDDVDVPVQKDET
jgi:uncharacterized protein (TIGR02300 family)